MGFYSKKSNIKRFDIFIYYKILILLGITGVRAVVENAPMPRFHHREYIFSLNRLADERFRCFPLWAFHFFDVFVK